jgi:N-methylhydantoinase B
VRDEEICRRPTRVVLQEILRYQNLDKVRLEVLRNALIRISEQMAATIQKTAYSPVIYEGLDFVCGVLDSDSNLVAGTSGIPCFLGNLHEALLDIDSTIGFENLEPGDVVMCNDPYTGGGTHGNDISAFFPLFRGKRLYGFTAFKGHTADMGGIQPGGYFPSTTEIYQELFRVVPVRIYRRGQMNEDVFRLIRANSRTPDLAEGDIKSMVSAVKVGAKRVEDLVEKYGIEEFEKYRSAILDHSDLITREKIKSIPEGDYCGDLVLDGDGDDDKPNSTGLKVDLEIKVKGDEMYVDLSRSSRQSPGSMNCTRASSISFVRYAFKSVTSPFIPVNDGCFRSLHVNLGEGTIFNPQPPAAASLWVEVGQAIPDLFLEVLATAIPDDVRASSFGSDIVNFCYGKDPRTRRFFIIAESSAPGGWGASKNSDGPTLFATTEGDSTYPMCEVFEVHYPFIVEKFELIRDSGGPGKNRGGLGVNRTITPIAEEVRYTLAFDRQKFTKPRGIFGGKDGSFNYVKIHKRDGSIEMREKATGYRVVKGEKVEFLSGGGGGYGSPIDRDPEKVESDVIDGYVSLESARNDYCVAIDPTAMKLNREETAQMRKRDSTK